MSTFSLSATVRSEIGKRVDHLRRDKKLPAVVYGHGFPSQSVVLMTNSFEAIYKQAGSTSLIDLTVGDAQPVKVLIHGTQRHPTTGRFLHADFYVVSMSEKLEADIELTFVGESPAVKEQGGIFIRTIDKVKVSCLPSDLVSSIEVDISALKSFEDRIHISDLVVPPGLTILDKGEEVVASVTPPRSEEEIAGLSAKVEENIETVEVAKKAMTEDQTLDAAAVKGDEKKVKKNEKKSDDKK